MIHKPVITHRPDTNDKNIIDEVYNHSPEYKKDKLDNKNPELIVDIGGHIGCYSSLMRKYFINAEIHSYELDTDNYKYLKMNAEKYNFIPHNIGIVGNKKMNKIIKKEYSTASPMLVSNNDTLKHNDVETYDLPELMNINDLVESFDKDIDIMKIDIEGGEFSVIPALTKKNADKIDYIAIEIHSLINKLITGEYISPIEFANIIENKGFVAEYFRIDDKPYITCGYGVFRNKKKCTYLRKNMMETNI